MPSNPPLPIDQAALLVIDVQDSFKANPERWANRNNPQFEAHLTRLLGAFRAAGRPVIFVLHEDADAAFAPGGEFTKLMEFVERRESEPIVVKNTRNAFTSTDLAERLAALGVRRLVVTGIQTEQCCETTARVAGDLGYDVDFVTEATLTFPIRHLVDGVEEVQTPAAITRATEFSLRGRFARIATAESLARQVEEAALSPA